MSTRTLRRHSRRSLPRVRAPREGPRGFDGHGDGNGPPDSFHGGGGGPGNSNERSHSHDEGNHGLGNNGGGNGNGNPHDTSPISPPPPPPQPPPPVPPGGGGDHDPPLDGGANVDGAGSHGSASSSTDAENMGGSNGANSGSNPPANASGGSSSATSVSDPDSSRSSDGTPSKTSDNTSQSSSGPPANAPISDSTTSAPVASAVVIPSGGSSAAITPAPSPNPSSSGEVTPAAALSHHSNSGAIAGGVVGAVLFFAIALGAWIVYKRRRKNRLSPSAEYLSNASKYPFAQGFGAPVNRSGQSQLQGGNYGGAGTGGAGNANFRSLNSRFGEFLENSPQMEQYRDERPIPSLVPLSRPPQPEVLYSTRPAGTPPPTVPVPGSTPGTPTTPSGRRIPFGTGTFQFPPRPLQPQQPTSLQPQ